MDVCGLVGHVQRDNSSGPSGRAGENKENALRSTGCARPGRTLLHPWLDSLAPLGPNVGQAVRVTVETVKIVAGLPEHYGPEGGGDIRAS